MNGYDVIVIFGPTGSGKTDLSIELAKRIGGEIINLDSMQVYREIEIGTAKPTPPERSIVPHHLFDIVSVADDFTVADYQKLARQTIQAIKSRGKKPILVGGTGLYLSSLYYDFTFRTATDRNEKVPVSEQALREWEGKVDIHNPRRLQRALRTGQVYDKAERVPSDLRMLIVWPDWPRDELHRRINRRVDQMLERGLMEEVRALEEKFSLAGTSSARQGIGYKELMAYFAGETDLETATELIRIHTRQYAKRQITWVKNQYPKVHRLDATLGVEAMVEEIIYLEALSYED